MDLSTWIDDHAGIAHRLDALDAGFTRHAIGLARTSGAVRVIRRNWIVTDSCDAQLLFAATRGGRLSCLTLAARRGWWNLSDGRVHLSVASTAAACRESGVALHWSATPMPVSRRSLVQPPTNALLQIAECQPLEQALVVFESAIRVGDADLDRLRRIPVRSRRFRAVLEHAGGSSDSGIETLPKTRLARLGVVMRQQVVVDGHPVDGLIGERIVLQFDGHAPHQQAHQRNRDLAQDRRLMLAGYAVLRFSYQQVVHEWPLVEREILDAIAQQHPS